MSKKRSINDINKSVFESKGIVIPEIKIEPPADAEPSFNADAVHYRAKAEATRPKRTWLKALVITLAALIVAVGAAFAIYLSAISHELNVGNKGDDEILAINDALGSYKSNFDEPFYMLLLGTDARNDEEFSRTDTNVVVRIDPEEDIVTLVSIPRDTKIDIKGYGTQKFNAAYAFDKVPGVIKATEDLLNIKIDHYAEVDFLALKDLVDAIGGVTVENESLIDNEKCDDGDGNHYVIEEGTVTLNGGEALTFARNRDYVEGDFVRTSNQRKLIEAIVRQALSTPITNIPAVVGAGARCVTTDLTISDIIGLAQKFADSDDIVMYSAMLPSFTAMVNGISFVINDEDATKKMMRLVRAGMDPSGIVSTKTEADLTLSDIDTSNTLMLSDDEEVATGGMSTNADVYYNYQGYQGYDSNAYGNTGGSSQNGYPGYSGGNAGYEDYSGYYDESVYGSSSSGAYGYGQPYGADGYPYGQSGASTYGTVD